MPRHILYIIVNYRRAQLCAELAHKVLALPQSGQTDVMILDNSETDEDKNFLAALPPRERLIIVTPPRNLGYFGGGDFGLTSYLAKNALPNWVIVSNPDIDFPDDQFLTTLCSIQPQQDIGALAPDIRLAPEKSRWDQGVAQNPMMEIRPSATRMRLLEIIYRIPALYWLMAMRYRWRVRRKTVTMPSRQARAIYAAHGSATVFTRRYFECGGNLRHGVFLYGEELFVAEELRSRGLKCLFEPRLRLCHVGGATTSILGTRRLRGFNYEAIRYLRRRYFSGADSAAKKA
jgi:GT2 family glycosyltransferase